MNSINHRWDLDYDDAVLLQRELAGKVSLDPISKKIRWVAGGDLSFNRYGEIAYSGFVVYDIDKNTVVEEVSTQAELMYPYIPGLLSFREMPPLLKAWQKLSTEPDVVMLDGHGISHPRGLGLASHFGLWVDKPTIGCAKNLLVGDCSEPGTNKGQASVLWLKNKKVGFVLRTRTNVKPIYVSPGHKIEMQQAKDITLRCSPRYKIPEPTRAAHNCVNIARKRYQDTKNIN